MTNCNSIARSHPTPRQRLLKLLFHLKKRRPHPNRRRESATRETRDHGRHAAARVLRAGGLFSSQRRDAIDTDSCSLQECWAANDVQSFRSALRDVGLAG
jgi:hypothetical protein